MKLHENHGVLAVPENLLLFVFEVTFQATMPLVPRPRAALRLPWAKVKPPLRGCDSAHSAATARGDTRPPTFASSRLRVKQLSSAFPPKKNSAIFAISAAKKPEPCPPKNLRVLSALV